MQVKMTRSKFKSDVDAYTKKLHGQIISLWKDAVRVFVETLISDSGVHVRTGMTMGSIVPLGRMVRMATEIRATAESRRSVSRRLGYTTLSGNYISKDYQSIEKGVQLGKKAFNLSFGTPRQPKLNFQFKILIWQWHFHEPEWRAMDNAERAMKQFLADNAIKYVSQIRLADHLGG